VILPLKGAVGCVKGPVRWWVVVVDAGCEVVVKGWDCDCVVVVVVAAAAAAAAAGRLKLKVPAATAPIAVARSTPVLTRLGQSSDRERCLDKANRASSVVRWDRDPPGYKPELARFDSPGSSHLTA
jgi:hypothetical protein